jgi:hypothetical protein
VRDAQLDGASEEQAQLVVSELHARTRRGLSTRFTTARDAQIMTDDRSLT